MIALFGVALVVIGTFLPIVEYDFGGPDNGLDESVNGWSAEINDGPIHVFVALLPLAMGVLVLNNRARVWVKVLLIVSAVIGFFWVAVRLADLSGSLEEGGLGDVVAELTDPGVGLYVISVGWVLVLAAGILTKAGNSPTAAVGAYPQPGRPPPVA